MTGNGESPTERLARWTATDAAIGFSILIESFIVTVIGGMGSIGGALVAAILIGLCRTFGAVGLPLFTEIMVFTLMAVVLVTRPNGLFGKAPS